MKPIVWSFLEWLHTRSGMDANQAHLMIMRIKEESVMNLYKMIKCCTKSQGKQIKRRVFENQKSLSRFLNIMAKEAFLKFHRKKCTDFEDFEVFLSKLLFEDISGVPFQ